MADSACSNIHHQTGVYRVLVIGGYGTFGGRLVELLCDTIGLLIFVAGRSQGKAQAFCNSIAVTDGATLVPVALDRGGDLSAAFDRLRPSLVIDASGPFQNYGHDDYKVVEAAIKAKANYLDLADCSEFVDGIRKFEQDACGAGVFALSGVSSFPVLTCAVVRALSHHVAQPKAVTAGIAPSPYAGVGQNVIRAIASYSGRKVNLRRDGEIHAAYPLTESLRYTITVSGSRPLKPTRFSLVDVPDLKLIPELWPEIETVWVGAGPVPEVLHRFLNLLARLVKWRVVPTLLPLAGLMHKVMNTVRWGAHRGGMFVHLTGLDEKGQPRKAAWHLIAEGDDGPYIPSMAAEVVVRRCLAGDVPSKGARPAHGALELEDYNESFEGRAIATDIRVADDEDGSLPVYRRVLGRAWFRLPPTLQVLHSVRTRHQFSGAADVDGATGLLAKAIAKIMGFPSSKSDVPVSVVLETDGNQETWTRDFGGQVFQSTQEVGCGSYEGLIIERFGVFAFGLAAVIRNETLHLEIERWAVGGISLPLSWAPTCDAFEVEQAGCFRFSVRINVPLAGMLVHYSGWLEPDLIVVEDQS